MANVLFSLLFLLPNIVFAQAAVFSTASSAYVQVESYNDSDSTGMAIDFLSDDALAADLKASKVCGADKFNDLMYYGPVDYSEDVGYLYSQPAAALITRLQEKGMLTSEDFNTLSFELNKATNELMSYLDGKTLNVCADYTVSAYADSQTTYYIMVNGVVEFAIFVGRPD